MNGDAGSEFSRVGPQIIFGMDGSGRCTMSIGQGLRELGLEASELVGRDLFEVYRDNPVILTSIDRALAGETFTVSEEVEGRLLWTYFQALHDADGGFTGSLGVTTDVTDQRRDEADARAARIRVTALSNLSTELTRGVVEPDEVLRIGVRVATETFADIGVIWLLGEDEDALQPRVAWHADPAARDQLDRAVAEVRGWEGWLDPGSVDTLDGPLVFDIAEVARTGLTRSDAVRVLVAGLGLRHGLRLPVRSRGRTVGLLDFGRGVDAGPFSEDDVAFGLDVADRFTLAYDNALLLAELRSAVADLTRFQALVEASSDFIAIADLEGRALYVNPSGRAMIGLPAGADVRNTAISDHLTPEGVEASLRVEQPAVLARGHWEGESTLRDHRGGPPIPVAIASFLMHDVETGAPFALATVQRDITERHATDSAMRELAEQRQALLARLVRAQEAERAQIAGDVHDDPVQALAAVDLRLGLLRRQLEQHAPQLLDTLGPVQESVARANQRLRALLFDLEAPDLERGLGPALERAAAEILKDTGVHATVDAASEPETSPSTRAVAYRIAREALINVRKHARARDVTVTITGPGGGLAVEIADDGHGLAGNEESPPGHHGLSGMRDRAALAGGQLAITPRRGGGTVVACWLPDVPLGEADDLA